MQRAVGGVEPALLGGQALILPSGNRLKSPPINHGVPRLSNLSSTLATAVTWVCKESSSWVARSQMGVEHGHLATVVQWQVRDQQGVFWFELPADDVGRRDRQLQAFGVFDPVAAQGCQLPANAAENMRFRHEVRFPVEGLSGAWIQVGDRS